MAQSYPNTPVLSKIRIGANDYYLKDSDARSILNTFNNTVCTSSIGYVSDNNDSLVTAKNIKAYVDDLVAVGLVIEVVTELPTAGASTMGKIYLMADAHSTGDSYDEYITVRTGNPDSYAYAWEKIGNTDIDLSGYVNSAFWTPSASNKITGQIVSGGGLTISTKGGSALVNHTFGTFADAKLAKGNVSVVTGITSAKATAKGSIVADSTNGTQITGTVSSITTINGVGTLPSKAADSFTANTPTTIDTTKFNGGSAASLGSGFYTAGTACSFTEGAFTANVPTKIDTTKFSGGSMTGGSVTFPTFTKASIASKPTSTFAKAGVTASVGTGTDAETLIIATASTGSAVTDVTINGGSMTSGSYTAPTFTAASLGTGFYTAGSAASKTADTFTAGTPTIIDTSKFNGGSAASLGSGFYTKGTAASFSEGKFTAGSLPTTKTVTPTFTGDKFAFSGTEVDVTVTPKTESKEVTVYPYDGTV